METYKVNISKEFIPLLNKVKKCQNPRTEIKVLWETESDYSVNVEITAESESEIFFIGFFLERERNAQQKLHYDLQDNSTLSVEVPSGFILLCKAYEADPSAVLRMFAGDLSQHPFITGGSDERDLARAYFQRAYLSGGPEDEDKLNNLFDELIALRQAWGVFGNSEMDEYKAFYTKGIKELSDSLEKDSETKASHS